MKTLTTLVLALGAVLSTTGLYAQDRAVANIPFEFTAQNTRMPAGEYTLRSLSGPGSEIQIQNNETGKSVLVHAPANLSTYKSKAAETGKLIFHCYGDRYFFSEVWTADGPRGRALPDKAERELLASAGEMQLASVAIPKAGAK